MRVGDESWAQIKAAYVESRLPLTEIAHRHAVSVSAIRARARRETWPARGSRAGARAEPLAAGLDPTKSAETTAPSVRSLRRGPDSREVRVLRLFHVIDLQLDSMEKHMSTGEALSPQDQERQARALSAMLGNLEKATEAASEILKADMQKPAARADEEAAHAPDDADRMRREIAERLERLSAKWLAGANSE